MPIPSADLMASFDFTTGKKVDISPVLSAILLTDTATLGLIGMGPAVPDIEHKWNSDSLNAPYVTLNNGGNVAAIDTSFVVDSTANLSVGALLMASEAVLVPSLTLNSTTYYRPLPSGPASEAIGVQEKRARLLST